MAAENVWTQLSHSLSLSRYFLKFLRTNHCHPNEFTVHLKETTVRKNSETCLMWSDTMVARVYTH